MQSARDPLGQACFFTHIAVLTVVIVGWAWPEPHWLIGYLIFLPAMFLHWKLNRDACVLNNLENWLRFRRWRSPETNREEGQWLRTLLTDATGLSWSKAKMDALIYGALSLFWLLALARLFEKF